MHTMGKIKRMALPVAVVVIATMIALTVQAASGVHLKHGDSGSYDSSPKIAIAYVEYARPGVPDPDMFTHLIYSAADFNEDCETVTIPTPAKLRSLSELKKINPKLKVIFSVGGSRREGFSEMARDKKKRKNFAKCVKNVLDSFNLDGVDLDWEFPTTEAGGHTATPQDDKNYAKVVKELRKTLGKDKWISFYSNNSGKFIDFKRMMPYVDYVNVSGYNLSIPKDGERAYHQSPLYPSDKTGKWCVKSSVERHIENGAIPEKILIGIPFFGRGKSPFPSYIDCSRIADFSDDANLVWDKDARAPYYADREGNLLMGFDNENSIKAKFDFIRANNLPGVFIWNYDSDYDDHSLGKAVKRLSEGKGD